MTPQKQEILPFTPKKGRWNTPPFGILEARSLELKADEKLLMERAKLLQQRCGEFSVQGAVQQIHPLAVGIQRQNGLDAPVEGPAETRSKGGALALVGRLDEDLRAGVAGAIGRVIGGSVVNDQDRQVGAGRGENFGDVGRLVVCGDQGEHFGFVC